MAYAAATFERIDYVLAAPFIAAVRRYRVWQERIALSRLDATALADLGLTRSQAQREARRSFWSGVADRS